MLIPEGCKKYEDGPWLSCRTKKHRLLGGWGLKTFYVNGVDSTFYFKEVFHGLSFDHLGKHGYDRDLYYIVGSRNFLSAGVTGAYIMGDWDFLDDHNKISLQFIDWGADGNGLKPIAGFGPFGTSKLSKWLIKKLTNDEMTIITMYNLTSYELELEKH